MGHTIRMLFPLLVIGGGMTMVAGLFYGVWMLGRYFGREESLPIEIADVQARMHRLEQAMSQTTAALDRLEAAHRISARMLSDLPDQFERLPASRPVTPH
jgi:Tfp pilus assembly protein PilN